MKLCIEETEEFRLAKDGETPNCEFEVGLNEPDVPHLYSHLQKWKQSKKIELNWIN